MKKMKKKANILLIGITYISFISIGLPDGLLGVAWPSIRASFSISLASIGALLLTTTVGYLVSSFNSGYVLSRIPIGLLLMVSSILIGLGMLGYAFAPAWWIMVAFGFLNGLGIAAIDAILNTYAATNYHASFLNWLHASFGLGATLGPLIMTTVLSLGQPWRWGYIIVAFLQVILAVAFGLTRNQWRSPESEARPTSTEQSEATPISTERKVKISNTLRLPGVWISIALFFVYSGIEVAAGQWSYSLLTEARSVPLKTAGLWISFYWGSLMIGRLLLGIVVDHLKATILLRVSMLAVICGTALIWWNATNIFSFLGLVLMGFSLAPIFPTLISNTPNRLESEHVANAIGFQVGAADLGIVILPGFAGFLAEKFTLEVIGLFLLVFSIIMFLLHETLIHELPIPRNE